MTSYGEKNATHRRAGGVSSRSKSVSIFQLQFEGGPQLKTAQQKSYTIPSKRIEEVASKLKDKNVQGEPVFMAPDGTFYDINYTPVFKHKVPDRATAPHNNGPVNIDEEEEESLQEQLFHLYNSIPQIDEFENFFDYEQAFLGWKFAVETIFSDIRLPMTSGRAYYRPRVCDYQRGRDNSTFDYRPSVSSFSIEGDNSDEKSIDRDGSEIEEDNLADSADNYDLSALRQELLESEPWDSHLYPQEPQPADYDTFEDYEEALTRWASICGQTSFFPPHAAQLKELIPIQAISEQRAMDDTDSFLPSAESKLEQLAKQTASVRSGIYEIQFFTNTDIDHTNILTSLHPTKAHAELNGLLDSTTASSVHFSKDAIFNNASSSVKQSIHSHIENMLSKLQQNQSTFKSNVPPLLPRIHGVLPSAMPSLTKPNNSLKNTNLRRTDLTPEQLKGCYDCPPKIGGQNVDFKIPIHDIMFDHNRLKNDQAYSSVIINQFRTLRSADRNNHLFSWYNPLVPSSTHQKHRDDIDHIITTQHRITKDQLNINNISEILYGNMYLDKFSDLLDASFSEDFDGGKSYATVLTKGINPDNVDKLLSLIESSKSPLFHAKMSYLIMNIFSGNQGSPIVERLIQTKDVKNLSLLTYSFDYLTDLSIDLYPWSDDTYSTVKQVLGDSMDSLIKLTFCYYYLTVIARVLEIHVHLYYSKSVVTQSKVSLAHSMATLLQQNTPDILDKLFTGIRHRSTGVSSFCLFILLQLMHNQEGMAIHNCLRADSSFLFERAKGVCDSKMKHVQFAARRLFAVLSKTPWIDFIYKEYTKDPESAVRDFLGDEDKKPSNLLLELVLDFFQVALDRTMDAANASLPMSNTTINTTPPLSPVGSPPPATSGAAMGSAAAPTITIGIKNKFLFVLDGMLFHTMLQFVLKHTKLTNYQMITVSSLLSKLSIVHSKLGTVNATHDVKPSQKKWGNCLLSLSPIDVRNMSSRVSDLAGGAANPASYVIRRNILCCIRHLFKHYPVFEIIKKEEDFYSRLLSFCRDGNSPEFNKEAWCLLYQIMKNHSGTLEGMAKETVLTSFMELVGTSSHTTVITNGLHYITKMFTISPNTVDASKKIKIDKVIEKDLKSLNSLFISKRLFIKIHMIYKKYINTQPGLAFIELAKFYNTMYTSENCAKLFKDTIKKTEYKEGLEKIGTMYDPFRVETPTDNSPANASPTASPVTTSQSTFTPTVTSSAKSTVSSLFSKFKSNK